MAAPAVVDLKAVGPGDVALVGGKGAALGALSRIDGIQVPGGFCVTTEVFRQVMEASGAAGPLGAAVPAEAAAAVAAALARHGGAGAAWAVRSSATAEDLADASFAGQHDSFLQVTGEAEVLRCIARCWASLYSERAAAYRLQNGFGRDQVEMAVVVQRMAPAVAAGVLFTADPLSGNRRVAVIEAVPGLGEALVSGQAAADRWKVRDGRVVERMPAPAGRPVLEDVQAVALAALGRRIEARFGAAQDIEWTIDGQGGFHVVQSRPITGLFPIPETADADPRVWLSVGHQQMMTDAMSPLGRSLFQLIAFGRMDAAGGRLWVEVSARLGSPAGRAALMAMVGRSDPLTGDALEGLIERGFIPEAGGEAPVPPPPAGPPSELDTDPAIAAGLVARGEASLGALERDFAGVSGPAALDLILADIPELKRVMFDHLSQQAIMAGMQASWRLNEVLQDWLGEAGAADVLSQSVAGNVTSEMGLALLDVADAIRPHPEVVRVLAGGPGDGFLDVLPSLSGGREARAALDAWLGRYGMRCPGEIDIARPRWSERPSMLLPVLLGHVRDCQPGEAERRFDRGLAEARAMQAQVLERLRALPDGEAKAQEARGLIDRLRTFAGYREYPKYFKIRRFQIYKRALMAEAGRLARAGAIEAPDDIFLLSFEELQEAVRAGAADRALIARRRQEMRGVQALTPPRVLTSEGEALTGAWRRDDLPAGALAGLAVSAGVVEGRARVVLDPARADLEPGDILVTTCTDPSWTPLFLAAAGLVTEVGALMSHGSVIAREYGLPAVVGVQHATRLIADGRRIRVNGAEGHVELLA